MAVGGAGGTSRDGGDDGWRRRRQNGVHGSYGAKAPPRTVHSALVVSELRFLSLSTSENYVLSLHEVSIPLIYWVQWEQTAILGTISCGHDFKVIEL